MAFDPQREDYQRLGLRFARSLGHAHAPNATRAFASFGRRFAQNRDSLPQSDEDRAFHLVAMATRLIDYELPFADEQQARKLIENGHRILDEALSIDPQCYDAIRMKAAATNASFESFLEFLAERADEVRAHCEERRASIPVDEPDERARLAADIAMRPYVRWLATQAEQALICGRNREAIAHALTSLQTDPSDGSDVRFTAVYAYAKLEDDVGLESFLAQDANAHIRRPHDDAWVRIAQLALAHKRHDLVAAGHALDALLSSYPHAAEALIRQNELPDGVFARLAVMPYSEDELILALSEGTVLLQEGVDPQGQGVLGGWIARETSMRSPQAMLAVMNEQRELEGNGGQA